MSWGYERRGFWVERVGGTDQDPEYRQADHRLILGPLLLYHWSWKMDVLGPSQRYRLWPQIRSARSRPNRWVLRGPLGRRGGHPWGVRVAWSWQGWLPDRVGRPSLFNIWTNTPTIPAEVPMQPIDDRGDVDDD
jgi:hypothetical protein